MSKFVYIKSIPKLWKGLDNNGSINWEDPVTGKKLNRSGTHAEVATIECPGFSMKVGGYATGLYKPWLEKGVQKVEGNRPLTLQDYYERKHGVKEGTYTNRASDPKGVQLHNEDIRTWFELYGTFRLREGTNVLDMSIPHHELMYECFLESPRIANSEKEWREHKWPKANFYIAMENESDEIKYTKNVRMTKTLALLHHDDLTLPLKRQFCIILDLSNARTILSEEQVHNMLYEYIENSVGSLHSGNNIDKFNELFALLKTAKGKGELEARFLLKKLVDYRIVLEKQGSYTWIKPTGPIVLGENYTEAIDFFLNPKKAPLVEDLKAELKIKE